MPVFTCQAPEIAAARDKIPPKVAHWAFDAHAKVWQCRSRFGTKTVCRCADCSIFAWIFARLLHEFCVDFCQHWVHDFCQHWVHDFCQHWVLDFCQHWVHDFLRGFLPALVHDFCQHCVHDFCHHRVHDFCQRWCTIFASAKSCTSAGAALRARFLPALCARFLRGFFSC